MTLVMVTGRGPARLQATRPGPLPSGDEPAGRLRPRGCEGGPRGRGARGPGLRGGPTRQGEAAGRAGLHSPCDAPTHRSLARGRASGRVLIAEGLAASSGSRFSASTEPDSASRLLPALRRDFSRPAPDWPPPNPACQWEAQGPYVTDHRATLRGWGSPRKGN